MKWITSTDIKHWADTRDAQGLLPELISRLIMATSTNCSKIRFPSGDAILLRGWDGVLASNESIYNIPSGISLWECGTNSDPKDKANKDYTKRTNNSLGYDKTESTFVFVTPRVWDGAAEWVRDKKQLGEWKEVVVISAVELEEWLSLCPAVALWLASKIAGKSINKVYNLESYWDKQASGKGIKLEPNILLGGREREQQEVYNSISESSVAIIQSMAQNESIAFAVACILESPDKYLLSKAVVVEDEDTLGYLIDKYSGIILIANVWHKNHMYATHNGHCIIYAASAAESFLTTSNAKLIQLPLLDREKFIKSLVNSGIEEEQAERLSRETARNITILKRRLEIDYTCPEWAKPENIRDLIPAIMVARWSETVDGDKKILSLMAGEAYDSYIVKLLRWSHLDDSPIAAIDGKWRVYSPYEAFGYAAPYITAADFAKYREAIGLITSDNDPDAIEKMTATGIQFWKPKQKYSVWLKEGLFQTAVMISLSEDRVVLNTPVPPSIWIDRIISSILSTSSIEWWFSNKPVLNLISEASPKSYLDFIQSDLTKEDSIIRRLFTPKGANDLLGPREDYTHILFSLQAMLWDEKWLLQISCILLDLSSIHNETNLYNKPINALYEAYAIWRPQTYASITQRLQALDIISKKYPEQAFNLFFKLINGLDHATISGHHPMKWRCYNYTYPNISQKDINDSIGHICKLIISICDNSEEQICKILELASQKILGYDNRRILFENVVKNKHDFVGSYAVTNAIRHTIYRHTVYSNTEWALPQKEIDNWIALLSELESTDILEKNKWLFEDRYVEIVEIDRTGLSYEEIYSKTCKYKNQAILDIEAAYGFDGICEFVKMVKCPGEVGESYAYSANIETYQRVLDILINEKHEAIFNFAKGFFHQYTFRNGVESIIPVLNSLDIYKYEQVFVIPITVMPCACRAMWAFVDTLPTSIQTEYWTNLKVGLFYKEDAEFIIKKMIEYKRYDAALEVIYYSHKDTSINADVIEETIIDIIKTADNNILSGMQHELAGTVYALDVMEDANTQTLYSIEFLLYRILEHYGNINETRLIKEIISNPESMMELIDKVYSSDEHEKVQELEQVKNNNSYALLSYHILSTLRKTPYVNHDNSIEEIELNNYIDQLQVLGNIKHKIKGVNTVIGELLGNYPETEDYPPTPICDIIERLNNKEVNDGFRIRIYNKRGVTVRPALEGGTLEIMEAEKYKRYADKIRYTHPVLCSIFDDLSTDYYRMAKEKDTEVKIEKMEF